MGGWRGVRGWLMVVALAAGGCGGSSAPSPSSPTPTPTTPLPSLTTMLSEKVVGSPTAPVTMIEYSSFTCSHCGDFQAVTYPLIKAAYIDTGRVRFVYRDFPLNEPAIQAAMVARCSGDAYFATLDVLFTSQATWAYSTDYTGGIKKVVSALGITSNDVDACLAATDLRNGVLTIKAGGAAEYGISATPTFVINGQKVVGALPFTDFAAIIDAIK